MPVGAEIESWLERSLSGDETAWMTLLGQLWADVEARVARSRYMGQLRSSDDRREVVSRVFVRLRRNDLRALRSFPAWRVKNVGKTFDDWLTIVVTNVIRDYVAERLGDVDTSGAGLKRLVNTLAEALDDAQEPSERPAITNKITASKLLAAASRCLPPDQHAALTGWLAGAEFGDLATQHGWQGPETARGLVRAALARLRREFREEESC